MSARITMSGALAVELFTKAAKAKSREHGAISQAEKLWSRWAYVAEHFGDHEISIELDTVYQMLTAGARQKGLGSDE